MFEMKGALYTTPLIAPPALRCDNKAGKPQRCLPAFFDSNESIHSLFSHSPC